MVVLPWHFVIITVKCKVCNYQCRVRTDKNQVSKLNSYYFGVLHVLNHCSNHREILSAVLVLLEKTDFVIHVIDF